MNWPTNSGFTAVLPDLILKALAGQMSAVNTALNGYSVTTLLGGLAELAKQAPGVLTALTGGFGSMNKVRFCASVVKNGYLPAGPVFGFTDTEYHFARMFVLKARDDNALVAALGWGNKDTIAMTQRFYPEKAWTGMGPLDAVVATAKYAAEIGRPNTGAQAAIFSLGGCYGFTKAMSGTKPSGGATTCVLVARSVLHAAGFNVVRWNKMPSYCRIEGLYADLPPNEFGYSIVKSRDTLAPLPGFIYHIQGKSREVNGQQIDSGHVGIIIQAAGNTWTTIDGGSDGHITRVTQGRRLIEVTDSETRTKYGKWRFADDQFTARYGIQRAVYGWYNPAAIGRIENQRPMASLTEADYMMM